MTKGLKIAEPPRRRPRIVEDGAGEGVDPVGPVAIQTPPEKFDQVAATQKVQFNKRVSREVADGYEILAIRTRRKVPDLLAEALELLSARYGKP